MKKILSVFLTIAMLAVLCIPAFSAEPETPSIFALDRETTDLATYQAAMAAYVESQYDAIHAEIEAYQETAPSLLSYYYGGFSYQTGDIIVTSSTSSAGIAGHAGIVVQANTSGCKVLEITANTYNGANKHPTAVTISQWFAQYSSNYVLRSSGYGASAASYGNSYFINGAGKNMTYSLTSINLYETDDTYCSALVWRCFCRGAGVEFKVSGAGPAGGYYYVPTMFLPYDFITYRAYNGLTAVHSVNW